MKFQDSIQFRNNRYEVKLPFKEDHPVIEDNYRLSLQRLKNKSSNNNELLREYDDIIQNQIKMGIVEEINEPGEVGEVTYLPHKAVIREDKKSTKVRVVFDASAKSKQGVSLNDCLYKGPCLNPLLYDMLLRFRVHNIALTGDIEKAFLQVSVAPEDRNYLRFLWYRDVSSKAPEVVKLRFTRVIFGAICSQFLLNGTVKTHAEKYNKIDPEFSKKILRHFYVDDLNTGVANKEEGFNLYKKVKFRFQEAGLNIRKWRTNNKQLRELINSKEKKNTNNENEEKINNEGDKILGIIWNEIDDTLMVNLKNYIKDAEYGVFTKRCFEYHCKFL